jgi:hypothetical protein
MRYLLISFARRLAGQIDELVSVSQQLKPDDLELVNVILDFAEKKVVKSIIEGRKHDTTFEQLRDYYINIYPNLIEQLEREAPIEKNLTSLKLKLSPDKRKK